MNIHLSSPAACAALALIYMRTNNRPVAQRLRIPDELYKVGLIRPDVIMLRTLARCLILYDDIGQTSVWLESQIPAPLRECFRLTEKPNGSTQDLGMLARAYLYCKAGACMAMALKYPSTWNVKATEALVSGTMKPEHWRPSLDCRTCSSSGFKSLVELGHVVVCLIDRHKQGLSCLSWLITVRLIC